ncbi:MAG: hypothetical protein BZ138_07430 [Methanosphaera sp. rholeuAM270]|nr:MAG: hypothetical protein BZ138_07430 [Methanosphaera sp. rholeuAM270]
MITKNDITEVKGETRRWMRFESRVINTLNRDKRDYKGTELKNGMKITGIGYECIKIEKTFINWFELYTKYFEEENPEFTEVEKAVIDFIFDDYEYEGETTNTKESEADTASETTTTDEELTDIEEKAIQETLVNYKTSTSKRNEFPKIMRDVFSRKEEFMKNDKIIKRMISRYVYEKCDYDELVYYALIRAGWKIYLRGSSDTVLEIKDRHVQFSDGQELHSYQEPLAPIEEKVEEVEEPENSEEEETTELRITYGTDIRLAAKIQNNTILVSNCEGIYAPFTDKEVRANIQEQYLDLSDPQRWDTIEQFILEKLPNIELPSIGEYNAYDEQLRVVETGKHKGYTPTNDGYIIIGNYPVE